MVDISPISLKFLGFQQTPRAALINTYTVSLAFLGNISHSVMTRIGASYRSRLVNPLLSFQSGLPSLHLMEKFNCSNGSSTL